MERSKGDTLFDGFDDLVVDQDRLRELLAAVEDAVTDSVDLLHALDDAVLLVDKGLQNSLDGFVMGGHWDVNGVEGLLAFDLGLICELTVDADTLADALGADLFCLHVEQLILERRAAGVDDQNIHLTYTLL